MFADCDRFHLVAHSFGITYAIRIASILESHDKQGHITCIDGSPETIQTLFQMKYAHLDDKQLDNELVKQFIKAFGVKVNNNDKFQEISQEPSLSIKIIEI